MSSLDHSRLEDIRLYGAQAIDLVGTLSADTFSADVAVRLAVLHCLTLIGEAANQIRKVDLREIWTIVTRDLPPVVETIRDFLKDEE